MSQKTFSLLAGAIFSLVALAHLVRLVFRVEWIVAGWTVPMWLSVVGLLVPGFMAYQGFRLSQKA